MAANLPNMFSFVVIVLMGTLFQTFNEVATQDTNANNTDLAGCSCDLTVNACDINCCCDQECDESDKLTFSTCLDKYTPPDGRACVRNDMIIRNNTNYVTEVTADGLFCIYRDNYQERNYYNNPDVITSIEQFDNYTAQYGNYGYKQEVLTVYPVNNVSEYYKSGDEIYTVYENGAMGLLGLPTALTTGFCLDTNPASYLTDQHFECTRSLSSLAEDCMTNLPLDSAIYYQGYKVINSPAAFIEFPIYPNDTLPTTTPSVTVNVTTATTVTVNVTMATTVTVNVTMATTVSTSQPPTQIDPLYNSTYTVPIEPTTEHICIGLDGLNQTCPFSGSNLPSPGYDLGTGVCSNAVVKVLYTINYNGTDGIQSVSVQFTFREVEESMLPLTQGFQAQFISGIVGIPISGNPGYVIGKPVLAGKTVNFVNSNGVAKVAVDVSTDPLAGLTIATSSADGRCVNLTNANVSTRVPVNFGENLRSGCFIEVSFEDMSNICELIQQTVITALNGPDPPNVVATFGNSSTEITGDWVNILADSAPSTSTPTDSDTCRDIVTGQHWEIMYAKTGDTDNPQPKIIGVAYKYIVQNIKYQCYGIYCQPGNEQLKQLFEIVSSVEFIDASDPAVATTAARPTISARLPADFFYPFA